MATFSRRGSTVRVKLRDYERQLLQHLLAEMRLLLEADLPKADPVTGRLFPDAYQFPDDQEAYEELLGDQLRRDKLRALESLDEKISGEGNLDVKLSEEEANTWLTVINDLRLAIGTRLDVTEEMMEQEIDHDDPDGQAMSALHWLGWLQEMILREIHP